MLQKKPIWSSDRAPLQNDRCRIQKHTVRRSRNAQNNTIKCNHFLNTASRVWPPAYSNDVLICLCHDFYYYASFFFLVKLSSAKVPKQSVRMLAAATIWRSGTVIKCITRITNTRRFHCLETRNRKQNILF